MSTCYVFQIFSVPVFSQIKLNVALHYWVSHFSLVELLHFCCFKNPSKGLKLLSSFFPVQMIYFITNNNTYAHTLPLWPFLIEHLKSTTVYNFDATEWSLIDWWIDKANKTMIKRLTGSASHGVDGKSIHPPNY